MKVQNWPVDRPIPYARNPRKIPQKAVDKVADSIAEFGWRQPIVVDEHDTIIVGHTRLLAAQKLGQTKVPVHVAEGLSAAQIKAYRLADNRLNQDASWDDALLSLELEELDGFDLELTGFDPAELSALVAPGAGLTDEDAAPEAPDNPITLTGDVWTCGGHRVLCGDATVAEDVKKLLGAVKPMLMVTDPPYGVEYDPDWRNRSFGKADRAVGRVSNDDDPDWRDAWALFPGEVAYVWHAGNKANVVADGLGASGLEIRAQVIWAKTRFVIGRGHYHGQHEPCWYAVRKGGKGHWQGSRKESTLWQIEHLKSETGHSTQKPVECMRRPIENNSSPGQAVYDSFVGSGTTIIAAETVGRVCYAIDIDPTYVDVAVKRWQAFTGEEATLDEDGQSFAQTEKARAQAGTH